MLEALKTQPSPQEIQQCIASIDFTNPVNLLQLVTLLLKYSVPEVFLDVSQETKEAIARPFRTTIGLGNLIGRLTVFTKLNPSHSDSQLLNAYIDLLHEVFKPNLVRDTLDGHPMKKDAYMKEIEKLLYRGRAFSVLCEVALIIPNITLPPIFHTMDAYSRFLASELLVLTNPVPLITSLLSLGTTLLIQFFDVMFCPENLDVLISSKPLMKRFERKALIKKFYEYMLVIRASSNIQEDKIKAIYAIARQFIDCKVWDELLVEFVISKCDYTLNLLTALLVADPDTIVKTVLASWGSKILIEKEPIPKQEYRTHLLACLCAQISQEASNALLKDSVFMSAMSNRLLSFSNRVKALAIVFGDELSHNAGQKSIFSIDISEEISMPTLRVAKSSTSASLEEAWRVYSQPQILEEELEEGNDLKELQERLKPISLLNSDDIEILSDDEDDPSIASSKKVLKPLYIRDLLEYLSVDTKENQAYEKRRIALQTAPILLKQRTGFGSEVSFYAENLLTQLTALTNFYEADDFEELRLDAMIAVVVATPKSSSHICNLLLTGDYSLQQRMCLLSTIALSARELRGFHRKSSSEQKPHFPTKQLPPNLHRLYLSMDDEYTRIEHSIQDLVMVEPSESAKDQVLGGRVLRVSANLKNKRKVQESQSSKEELKKFGAMVGKRFFYPLVAVWYESGGISIGHYTPILIAHYIRTLSLILHSAYPVSVDITDMAKEYLDVVGPILSNVNPDQIQIIESVVTGLMVILDSIDDVILVTNFNNQISTAAIVIERLFELIIDDRVKSLCAGFLYKVSVSRANLERSLMDQMNGSFYS